MSFIVLAALAGVGLALITAPLGALIVWQRLAYFGDALAHSALLGVALSLFFSLNVQIGIFAVSICVALLMLLQKQRHLSNDTVLGILSHASLAFGLVAVGFIDDGRVDLTRYLLGDILTASFQEVIGIYGFGLVILGLCWRYWRQLISITVSESLAHVEGISVMAIRLLFFVMLAMTIALAINLVGVLLIVALLIIPAASARYLSQTPEQMVVFSAAIGVLSVISGICLSWFCNIPTGPAIVSMASIFFILLAIFSKKQTV